MSEEKRNRDELHHYVSDEQVRYYRTRTIDDILNMNESHAKFLWEVQTPEEQMRMRELKGKAPFKI